MRVEAHNRLNKPISFEATRVVVLDDFGNPVAVVVKIADGHVYVGHVDDPEFESVIRELGITRTTITTRIDPSDLPYLPPG